MNPYLWLIFILFVVIAIGWKLIKKKEKGAMNKGEMNKDCKLCGYPFTPTLHPINRLANSKGYCSWICLTGDLGDEAANEIIKKLKK